MAANTSKAILADCIKSFDAIGEEWIEDASSTKRSQVPDVLYHYTDAAGLTGMLSSGRVWLTDSRFLNDRTEVLHLMEQVKVVVEGKLAVAAADATALFHRHIHSRIPYDATIDTFIFSLSAKRDDLSQWRGYAREGRGFTIGFDADEIVRFSQGANRQYHFGKIEYEAAAQRRVADKIMVQIAAELQRKVVAHPELDVAKLAHEAARTYLWTMDNRSPFSKHESFAGEAEWRMAAYHKNSASVVQVRPSGLLLVPYVEVQPSGINTRLPIKSIGVGPGFQDAAITDAVTALCRQHGYVVETYSANTPYRRE